MLGTIATIAMGLAITAFLLALWAIAKFSIAMAYYADVTQKMDKSVNSAISLLKMGRADDARQVLESIPQSIKESAEKFYSITKKP